jgi:hypothetical protein
VSPADFLGDLADRTLSDLPSGSRIHKGGIIVGKPVEKRRPKAAKSGHYPDVLHRPATPPRRRDDYDKEAILKRDGYCCSVCGSRTFLEVHHIKPRGAGGPDEPWNLAALCEWCHCLVDPFRRQRLPGWKQRQFLLYRNPERIAAARALLEDKSRRLQEEAA